MLRNRELYDLVNEVLRNKENISKELKIITSEGEDISHQYCAHRRGKKFRRSGCIERHYGFEEA